VIALAMNTMDLDLSEAKALQAQYATKINVPVILPLEDGADQFIKLIMG